MIKKAVQASDFVKKAYAKPQMQAFQVTSTTILAGSGESQPSSTSSSSNEEYQEVSTASWF